MDRQRIRVYGTLAACFPGFGVIGDLLGWAPHGHPVLATVTLAPVIVGGAQSPWGSVQ